MQEVISVCSAAQSRLYRGSGPCSRPTQQLGLEVDLDSGAGAGGSRVCGSWRTNRQKVSGVSGARRPCMRASANIVGVAFDADGQVRPGKPRRVGPVADLGGVEGIEAIDEKNQLPEVQPVSGGRGKVAARYVIRRGACVHRGAAGVSPTPACRLSSVNWCPRVHRPWRLACCQAEFWLGFMGYSRWRESLWIGSPLS